MENYKVLVNNEAESKEVQDLFFELGYKKAKSCRWLIDCIIDYFATDGDELHCWDSEKHGEKRFNSLSHKEITIPQLRDLVVLKHNSIDDATHYYGGSKYYLTDSEFYQYSEGKWVNIDEYVDGMTFKKIEKEMKKNEYLVKNMYGEYKLIDHHSGFNVKDLIKVPEGAEIAVECGFNNGIIFYKDNWECQFDKKWITCGVEDENGLIHVNLKTYLEWGGGNKIVWQRSEINKDIDKGLSIQDKLKFIEKWLNGENIQYILGIETVKTQWHNFTEGAMQYIKRSDIKFREAPKYVTINGIDFKSIESLLKHVKKNFDLEDEE